MKSQRLRVLDDCFDMTIYLDYCRNLDEEIKAKSKHEYVGG